MARMLLAMPWHITPSDGIITKPSSQAGPTRKDAAFDRVLRRVLGNAEARRSRGEVETAVSAHAQATTNRFTASFLGRRDAVSRSCFGTARWAGARRGLRPGASRRRSERDRRP